MKADPPIKFFAHPPRPLQRLSLTFGALAVGSLLATFIWPADNLDGPILWGYGFISTWILDIAILQWKQP